MGALFQAMGGDGQGGGGQPQQPLATPYGQRNPQDQMMSMAGLLLASGMPLNKAIPQASQMMQQQAQGEMQQMQQMQMMQKMQAMQQQAQGDQNILSQLTDGGAAGAMMNPQMGTGTPVNGDMTLAQSLGNQSAPTAPAGNVNMGGANALPNNGNQQPNSTPPTGMRGISDLDKGTRETIANVMRVDRAAGLKMLGEALNPAPTKLNEEMAKQDSQLIGESRKLVQQAFTLKPALENFKTALANVPRSAQGRIMGNVSPYFNVDAQTAQAFGNQISLLAKGLLGMPNNNFSDSDRKFLVEASAGLANSPEANAKIIGGLDNILNKTVENNEFLEGQLAKKGNLSGALAQQYKKMYGDNKSSENSENSQAAKADPANMQQNKRSVADLSDQELMAIANGR